MRKRKFRTGDHVSWNSEAGRVSGRIVKVITSEIQFKGYTVHASDPVPAIHKGAALTKLVDGKK